MTVYLDNAAFTFPKPAAVVEAVTQYLTAHAVNPGRGVYAAARYNEEMLHSARGEVAALIGASDPLRVVFTMHATDSLNAAIFGVLRQRGGKVITTPLEHNAVTRPLRHSGRDIARVALDEQFHVKLDDLRRLLEDEVAMVVVHHASNVLGCEQDVATIGALCRHRAVPLVVDAAQSAGVLEIDVDRMGIDLSALSGHKHLFGPGGVGVLYVREGLPLEPWRYGGTGGFQSDAELQPQEMPWGYEAGTPNAVGIAGLLAGVRYVRSLGGARVRQQHFSLARRLLGNLVVQPQVTVLNLAPVSGVVSFNLAGWEPLEVARVLDASFDIAVGAGLSCAPSAHGYLGTLPQGAVRASVSTLSRQEDVDALADAVEKLAAAKIYTAS